MYIHIYTHERTGLRVQVHNNELLGVRERAIIAQLRVRLQHLGAARLLNTRQFRGSFLLHALFRVGLKASLGPRNMDIEANVGPSMY